MTESDFWPVFAAAVFRPPRRDARLSPVELALLVTIPENKPGHGGLHSLALAKPRGLSPATASRALFQLSQRGYVVLTPDSADRRRVVITRTAEGTKALSFLYREIQKGLPK